VIVTGMSYEVEGFDYLEETCTLTFSEHAHGEVGIPLDRIPTGVIESIRASSGIGTVSLPWQIIEMRLDRQSDFSIRMVRYSESLTSSNHYQANPALRLAVEALEGKS
jgi:hypothetical protein